MRTKSAPQSAPDEATVVTKAALRAADRLGIRNTVLARIVGVSEPTVSRMRRGDYLLTRDQKPFELAVLFIRLYRSLDAIVDGDDTVAQSWMQNENAALNGRPLTLIQSVAGLINVIQYLDARRAPV
ncbi:MbcA/ParS/Xre antitoxin family protein [Pseudorhodoplanes sinuspersici]|uniref:Transcriptional regulator, XRE family protein n=1 Tax=Pseudorhodoplanes sinuspersici TaxID=1235591 RepID=A0A1W6ZQ40_9HYPH|nr:MbcA/ParS/Xre antitoxin family protein [Pseudorhodoplanes sinuspersici]ARP99367.1 transcriptional regulator, XRE family protein [Pseudorhodoplanes sinuspersici]RKE70303.1 uncharacterized protein DUF2384 [Pseudorhodoplanes sinuspersici]